MTLYLVNTGWTDEARAASLAVRRAKAAVRKRQRAREREEMFEEQEQSGGSDFIDNWYPRGRDGVKADPHYGETDRNAPYGYVEGTKTPREEPLYDRYGRPIIPRSREDYNRPKRRGGRWQLVDGDPKSVLPTPIYVGGESLERDMWWLEQVREAENVWGPFGRKKQWMDEHPDGTEEDWEAYDRKGLAEWKAGRQ